MAAAFVDDLQVCRGQGGLKFVLDGLLDWPTGAYAAHGAAAAAAAVAAAAAEMTEERCSRLLVSCTVCREGGRGAGQHVGDEDDAEKDVMESLAGGLALLGLWRACVV